MKDEDHPDSAVARTISVIGSSWTCLILRDFFLHGPRRFQQLQDSLKGIAPTTLSERLRTLEENGVVERRFYSMRPPRAEYVLTAKGRELGRSSALCAIGAQIRALTTRGICWDQPYDPNPMSRGGAPVRRQRRRSCQVQVVDRKSESLLNRC